MVWEKRGSCAVSYVLLELYMFVLCWCYAACDMLYCRFNFILNAVRSNAFESSYITGVTARGTKRFVGQYNAASIHTYGAILFYKYTFSLYDINKTYKFYSYSICNSQAYPTQFQSFVYILVAHLIIQAMNRDFKRRFLHLSVLLLVTTRHRNLLNIQVIQVRLNVPI